MIRISMNTSRAIHPIPAGQIAKAGPQKVSLDRAHMPFVREGRTFGKIFYSSQDFSLLKTASFQRPTGLFPWGSNREGLL